VAPDEVAGDGVYTARFVADLAVGEYQLPVTAVDEAGNSATEDASLKVSTDMVAPVISDPAITYPFGLDSARPGDDVTVSATVTDNVGVSEVKATCGAFTSDVTLTLVAGTTTYTGDATVSGDQGTYPITITAEDAVGLIATDKSLTLVVLPGYTGYDVDLYEGWNLVSLPLIPESKDITDVLEGVEGVVSVQHYTGGPAGAWQLYSPAVVDLTAMEDGKGYWMDMSADGELTVTGYELVAPPPAVPPSYDVVAGWNMIGFKSTTEQSVEDYLGSMESALQAIYGYDAAAGAYFIPGQFKPGYGYWAAFDAPGTIYPSGTVTGVAVPR